MIERMAHHVHLVHDMPWTTAKNMVRYGYVEEREDGIGQRSRIPRASTRSQSSAWQLPRTWASTTIGGGPPQRTEETVESLFFLQKKTNRIMQIEENENSQKTKKHRKSQNRQITETKKTT